MPVSYTHLRVLAGSADHDRAQGRLHPGRGFVRTGHRGHPPAVAPESLWEKVDEWYGDAEWEAVREIVSKLKDECIRFRCV